MDQGGLSVDTNPSRNVRNSPSPWGHRGTLDSCCCSSYTPVYVIGCGEAWIGGGGQRGSVRYETHLQHALCQLRSSLGRRLRKCSSSDALHQCDSQYIGQQAQHLTLRKSEKEEEEEYVEGGYQQVVSTPYLGIDRYVQLISKYRYLYRVAYLLTCYKSIPNGSQNCPTFVQLNAM